MNSISTCFGHLYAHYQEIQLRPTACSCLSCCSCCDAGESGGKMCALCGECWIVFQHVSGIFMPIISRSNCVPLPVVVCPVVAVVMLASRVASYVHCVENVAWIYQATFSTQCTHLATRLSSITTATTGRTTIGSGTQLDLLMMGIKIPETCWDNIGYQ